MKVGPTVRTLSLSSAVAVVSAGAAVAAGAAAVPAGAAPFLGGGGAPFGCARCCIRFALSSVTMMSPCSTPALSSTDFSASDQVWPAALQAQDGVELGAEFERVRQRRIRLAVDRDRLVDVLAGIAVGEQRRFRRRAERLAGPLVVLKSRLVGGERHREITAVAGADADGAEGAGRRAEIGAGRRQRLVVAEQTVDEVAGTARGSGILRAAIVLRERRHHRAALVFAVGAADAAAAQALQAGGDLVEIGAHLLDLVVDRTALRRPAVEQREEARAFAAHALGLQRDPIEFGLLLGLGFLIAADLFILGRVAGAGAAVDGRQLSFEPHADRIGLRALLLGGASGFICAMASSFVCAKAGAPGAAMPSRTAQVKIRRERGALRISSISGH